MRSLSPHHRALPFVISEPSPNTMLTLCWHMCRVLSPYRRRIRCFKFASQVAVVNHPLYEIAFRKKKLSPENASNQSVTDIDNQRDARHNLTLQAYNNNICPS